MNRRDFDRVLALIKAIYRPRAVEDFTRNLAEEFLELVDARTFGCALFDANGDQNIGSIAIPSEASAPEVGERVVANMSEHYFWQRYCVSGESRFLAVSDLKTLEEYHRTNLYNEVYRQFRWTDACGLIFPTTKGSIASVGFGTERRATSLQKELANIVSGHIMQAYWNCEFFDGLVNKIRQMDAALDDLGSGVIITNSERKVCLETQRASLLLERYFGKRQHVERLPDHIDRWLAATQKAIQMATDLPPVARPMVVERDTGKLSIRVLSDVDTHTLIVEEQDTTADPTALQSLGLTRRQAEILSWLAHGKTNPEIAVILGMSARTVGKHVEHILDRLCVETRTAAAAAALETLRAPWR